MLKTLTLAGGLVLAGLTFAPQGAAAASFGNQADVASTASPGVELAQYYYYRGPRRRYRGYYGPRRGYYGRPYYRRGYYGRPYGYRRGYYGGAPGVYFRF